MKKINLILLFTILISSVSFAQRIDNKIITRVTPDGIIYHILPQDIFSYDGTPIEYDQTAITTRDSVRIGITLITDESIRPKKVNFIVGGKSVFSTKSTPAYTERNKKRWENRLFINVEKVMVEKFFTLDESPVIEFEDDNYKLQATTSQSKWDKTKTINILIYEQINLNSK